MALADLKAAQRVHAMTKEVDHTNAIMAAGYASACAIAIDDPDEFQRKTGFSRSIARHYHEKATATLSRASHAVISAIDAYDGPFQRTRAGNARSSIKDHLKAIPGFSELFGSQDYCNCTECQSILGAAAYFVDLMTFVDENMTGRVFRGKKAKDPLNLRVRRPDLWTLPLTCDNTNDLVAYLDIINPTLEDYIARQNLGHQDEHPAKRRQKHAAAHTIDKPELRGGRQAKRATPPRTVPHISKFSQTERPSTDTLVYQNTLAKSHASFRQPFTLPLEKLDIYLEHFSIPRVQIARALGAAPTVITKAALKISDAVYHQIKDANADQAFLRSVYRLNFAFSGTAGHVSALNVEDMLAATGFSRSDFEAAATTRFATKDGAYKIEIRSGKKSAESVQNDVERINGLTADALHRLYRFTRLLRATPWSISELDMILVQLGVNGATAALDDQALYRITQLLQLRARWSLPVDQACALWSAIPLEPKQGNLFDRLFNFGPLLASYPRLPVSEVRFVHAAFSPTGVARVTQVSSAEAPPAGTASAADHHNTTQRILAGLQVSDADLILLIAGLAGTLEGAQTSQADSDLGFILSLNNLTLLYRHASLARLLSLRVPQLFELIQLAGLPHQYVGTIDDLMSLLAFYDWYQASGYQLDDLRIITNAPVLNPAAYPQPATLAAKLPAAVATDHSLEFADKVFMSLLGVTQAESQQMIAGNPTLFAPASGPATPTFQLTPAFRTGTALQFSDTVFAFLPGVTPEQSQQIVAANPTLFTSVAGASPPALLLSPAFGPNTAITIPSGISLAPADANAVLVRYSCGAGSAGAALMSYHPVQVIPAILSGLLGVDAPTLKALIAMTGADLTTAEIFQALQAGANPTPAALAPLTSLVHTLVPLKVLVAASGIGVDDLSYIQRNAQLFAITNFNALSIASVQKLAIYASPATSPAPRRA
jgi:hypothetical protein